MNRAVPDLTVNVFARAPEPGRTKTRLIPVLGPQGAANLQGRLTWKTLETAVAAGVGNVELWCAPHASFPFFAACAENFPLRLRAQGPGDLGARMQRACRETLTRAAAVILIGTDVAALSPADLVNAARMLSANDVVLTPAEDGGYVLIGLRRVSPLLFENIEWGSPSVLEVTRERLLTLGWSWAELPPLWDVDRPEDLDRLARDPTLQHLVAEAAR